MTRQPTARQLEILRLHCEGLSLGQIAARLGIRKNSAGHAAATAATRLIRAPASADTAADRALALARYPEIAARFTATD